MKTGTLSLTANQEGGTVTGLNNTFAIRFVQPSVSKPTGGDTIIANVIATSYTSDGFQFTLSAPIPSNAASGDYKLLYSYL